MSSPSTRPAPSPTPVSPPTPGLLLPQLSLLPPPQLLLVPSVDTVLDLALVSTELDLALVSTEPDLVLVSMELDLDLPTVESSPPLPLLVMPSLPSTKKDTAKKESQDTRLNDDDDAEQSQLAQRQPRNHFKTQRIQEAMSFAKTPVRHHELNPIHYNRLFRFLIS